jgi:hypothetical protein
MAARRLTAKERRELPSRAFGIPSQRKYPVMVLNRAGEPVFSKGHAVDAKGRAKEEFEKGRIDRRQYNQIIRKATAAIRSVDRKTKRAKANPAAKKKASKRKVAKKSTRRRKNPPLKPKEKGLLFNVVRDAPYSQKLAHKKFGKAAAESLLKSGMIDKAVDTYTPTREGIAAVDAFAPLSSIEEDIWDEEVDRASLAYEPPGGHSPLRGSSRRKLRRKNPSAADHEAVGIKALKKSETYWRKYVANKSDHKNLVDAYKFLVIAHEELRYSDDPEPRLQADHALKRAHGELSKLLK